MKRFVNDFQTPVRNFTEVMEWIYYLFWIIWFHLQMA